MVIVYFIIFYFIVVIFVLAAPYFIQFFFYFINIFVKYSIKFFHSRYFKIVMLISLVFLSLAFIFNIFMYLWLQDIIKLSHIEAIKSEIESKTLKEGETLTYDDSKNPIPKLPVDSIFIKVMKRSGFWDLHRVIMLRVQKFKNKKKLFCF